MSDKEPPNNLPAEAAVLGSILYDNENYHRVADILKPDDFYATAHAEIYDSMCDLIEAGHTADGVTLRNEFEQMDMLKKVGGAAYLAELLDSAAFGPEINDYARIVVDLSMRRELMEISAELAFRAEDFNRDNKTRDSLSKGIQGIEALMMRATSERDKWEFADEAVGDELEILQENLETGRVVGMATGLSKLDEKLGGIHKGDLYVIGGASSMGKTALAMNLCTGLSQIGEAKVALFSQEMSRDQLSWRLAAAQARKLGFGAVEYQKLRTGQIGMNEMAILKQGWQSIPKDRFAWNCARGLTFQDVRASLRKAKRKMGGVDVVCIDYLQIMNIMKTRDKTRAEAIGDVTMGLKKLAGDEGFAVILLSQLSRLKGRDDKRPQLDDLRESGSIEQDADTVLMAYREEYYLKRREPELHHAAAWAEWKAEYDASRGRFQAIVAKQRMGAIGPVDLHFEMKTDVIVDDKKLLTEEELF